MYVLAAAIEVYFFMVEFLDTQRRHANKIEAEPGVEWIDKPLHPLSKKPLDNFIIPYCRACFDRDAPNCSICSEKRRFHCTGAFSLTFQDFAQTHGQRRKCAFHHVACSDRLGIASFHDEIGNMPKWRNRRVRFSENLVE